MMKSTTFGEKTFSYEFPTPVFGPKRMTCHIPWDRRLGDYGDIPVSTYTMDRLGEEFVKAIQGFHARSWRFVGTRPGRSRTGHPIIIVSAIESGKIRPKPEEPETED